jgi:cell fate (sporulation/competence/biofilm development) regulator YlbF (YheA/YmcA/DUF963 family)
MKNSLALFERIRHRFFMEGMMEKILVSAEELGRLIRSTDIYNNYERKNGLLRADGEAARILDEFIRLSENIRQRQGAGDIIENFEMDAIKELAARASSNKVIREYLEAQKDYLDLLMLIQNQISTADFATDHEAR